MRAGENPSHHDRRWTGFIAWWQGTFGRVGQALGGGADSSQSPGVNAPGIPTPLPADRPPEASPDKLEDAVQEFLTDWLVRRKYDEALQLLSGRAFACVNVNDNGRSVPLDATAARRAATADESCGERDGDPAEPHGGDRRGRAYPDRSAGDGAPLREFTIFPFLSRTPTVSLWEGHGACFDTSSTPCC